MTGCSVRAEPHPAAPVRPGDARFLADFEACRLTEREWTHLAHIRVAWTCLMLDGPQAALERIRRDIRRFNARVLGRPERYHDTVTVAYTRIIFERMQSGESWARFQARIDDLLDADSPLLLAYYSKTRLFSAEARRRFVPPDVRALPELDSD